jgi:hypothetical protein
MKKKIVGLFLIIMLGVIVISSVAEATARLPRYSTYYKYYEQPVASPTPTPKPTATPQPTASPTIPQSSKNLMTLSDFTLILGSSPQYAFLDNSVTYNGSPSIRIGPDYVGSTREIDGKWINIKPGDRIVAKIWILVGSSSMGDTITWHGGRLGLDLYTHTSAGYGIVDSFPHDGQEHINSVVKWGTNVWMQKTWDLIIPSTQYTQMHTGNLVMKSCNPVQIDSFVLWLDVRGTTDTGLAWFANPELYINP